MRELQNVIERAVILCDGETFAVDETWLRRETHAPVERRGSLRASLADREREMIETALAAPSGRVSGPFGAAGMLGVPRQTLDSRIAALHIDKHRFESH